jgi:hypothetical protein
MCLRKLHLLCGLALALLSIGCVLAAGKVGHQTEPELFETVSWEAAYGGRIAGKPVKVTLWRQGGAVMGNYCYEPCNPKRNGIRLEGLANGLMTETPIDVPKGKVEAQPSGRWRVGQLPGLPPQQLRGQWQSMDGKKRWSLELTLEPQSFAHAVDREVRLMANRRIESPKDCDTDSDLQVSALRIYRQGKLQQSLKTAAWGGCLFVQPRWVDANFDGWPDLSQALELPAGPNISYTTWLYDSTRGQLVLGPKDLQEITSPVFDGQAQRIYSQWRASCCSHGIGIYDWKNGKPQLVEQAESYVMPVRKGGKLMGCYIMPEYKSGHVAWPDALYRNSDGLAMGKPPAGDWCDMDVSSSLSYAQLQVFAPQQDGQKARQLSVYGMSKVEVKTPEGARYCPDLMVFDADARKLARIQLTENATESCDRESPGQ